jgi:hypothetical protein
MEEGSKEGDEGRKEGKMRDEGGRGGESTTGVGDFLPI